MICQLNLHQVIDTITKMKKILWLLAIPLLVCFLGLTGNSGLPANPAQPGTVTFSRASTALANDTGYVPVQFHAPIIQASLPAGRIVAIPDKVHGPILEFHASQEDQVALSMLQGIGEEETRIADKARNKKITVFMDQQKEVDSVEKNSRGGLGSGWLGEAMLSEETRSRKEFEDQLRQLESEPSIRKYSVAEPYRGAGLERFERNVDRFGGTSDGLQNEWKSSSKASYKFESWKPKSK